MINTEIKNYYLVVIIAIFFSILIINGKLSIDNWRGFSESILFWVQKIHLIKQVSFFCALSRCLHSYYMKILD